MVTTPKTNNKDKIHVYQQANPGQFIFGVAGISANYQ